MAAVVISLIYRRGMMMGSIPSWAEDILQDGKADKLQDDFDKFMIDMWFDQPWTKVWFQLERFKKDHGCLPSKRIAFHKGQREVSIPRFFAAYLPKTSGVLLSTQDRTKAFHVMKNEIMLTSSCDLRKMRSERKEKNQTNTLHNSTIIHVNNFSNFKDQSNSNWRKVK